jgi:hypothetical protein
MIEVVRTSTDKHFKVKKSHLGPTLLAQNEWRLCDVYFHFCRFFEGFLVTLREVLYFIITVLAWFYQ